MGLKAYINKRSKEHAGKLLSPHCNKDKKYTASYSRFEVDYIKINTEQQLEALVRLGYKARMVNIDVGKPSLISSEAITITSHYHITDELLKAICDTDKYSDSFDKQEIEQILRRSYTLNGEPTGKCIICGEEYPENMLIATFLKARSHCSHDEKCDFDNITALMCQIGCSDLFQKGYIYIDNENIYKNSKATTTPKLETIISILVKNKVPNWKGSSKYYDWHKKYWIKKV
ncbi:hypothetical protein C9J22_10245 [Photobacterium phosphoreum]|uniref:hypothetical protein n=1 Tax=Photobacterium phosphoreum TaxID=659 RepID=UPI000D15EE2C|nr:hypothetical protein [Photobacterium phosphoreum]PSU70743.1 hypothetical protein C9J22_10245 [Photobacterium phosphoreum]